MNEKILFGQHGYAKCYTCERHIFVYKEDVIPIFPETYWCNCKEEALQDKK